LVASKKEKRIFDLFDACPRIILMGGKMGGSYIEKGKRSIFEEPSFTHRRK
jgi:hypothetical protein